MFPKWQKAESTLLRIEPEHVDSRIEATVKAAINQQRHIRERRENCAEFSRALKTTGNPFVDQKNEGIHIAKGTNKMKGGTTPGAIGGISVEH